MTKQEIIRRVITSTIILSSISSAEATEWLVLKTSIIQASSLITNIVHSINGSSRHKNCWHYYVYEKRKFNLKKKLLWNITTNPSFVLMVNQRNKTLHIRFANWAILVRRTLKCELIATTLPRSLIGMTTSTVYCVLDAVVFFLRLYIAITKLKGIGSRQDS